MDACHCFSFGDTPGSTSRGNQPLKGRLCQNILFMSEANFSEVAGQSAEGGWQVCRGKALCLVLGEVKRPAPRPVGLATAQAAQDPCSASGRGVQLLQPLLWPPREGRTPPSVECQVKEGVVLAAGGAPFVGTLGGLR